jgi:hypothetical protein
MSLNKIIKRMMRAKIKTTEVKSGKTGIGNLMFVVDVTVLTDVLVEVAVKQYPFAQPLGQFSTFVQEVVQSAF